MTRSEQAIFTNMCMIYNEDYEVGLWEKGIIRQTCIFILLFIATKPSSTVE